MATIKGQNLRLKINGHCVAGATSCAMHIAAQTEDTSTKDDTGDWAKNEVTGLTWDAQADALVLVDELTPKQRTVHIDAPQGYHEELFTLHPGERIAGIQWYMPSDDFETYVRNEDTKETLPEDFLNTTTEDIEVVYTISPKEGAEVEETRFDITITIEDIFGGGLEELLARMRQKRPIDVSLERTKGTYNRETVQEVLQGQALITDLQLTAANRQNSTYSCKLTGTGELTPIKKEKAEQAN